MITAPRELMLCADDFGLSQPVSRGILHLAQRSRLSDVSCIVNSAHWPAFARDLTACGVRLGLHLNLTEGRPLSALLARHWPWLPPLPRLILLAHLRRLPRTALRDEMHAQFAAFEQAVGRPPDHIDGHQHVHHLPVLRELLLEQMRARPELQARRTSPVYGPGFAGKRALIASTGGRALGRRLDALGRSRSRNQHLFGVYDFADPDYRGLMQSWLAMLPAQGGMIFCHPGEAGADDSLAAARARELAYLDSKEFADDLAAAGVRLVA